MPRLAWTSALIALVTLVASVSGIASEDPTWYAYTYRAGSFVQLANERVEDPGGRADRAESPAVCPLAGFPGSWHILANVFADLTGDGAPECVLLVWRPWQDWPIMRWSDTLSPIAAHRDAQGDSAHIILVQPIPASDQPATYRELWAGSALAVPIIQIAAGDVDGDQRVELVGLEGDYATGREGPARHVAVWRWNGFGFTLQWRSSSGRFTALALADLDRNGAVDILVR